MTVSRWVCAGNEMCGGQTLRALWLVWPALHCPMPADMRTECVERTLEKDHHADVQSMDSTHMSRKVFLYSARVFEIACPMLGSMSK